MGWGTNKCKAVIAKCGYPKWALQKAVQPKNKKPTSTESKPASKGSVVIPYVKGFSEALKRTYNTYGINAYFKPTRTLRQIPVSPKDKTEKKDITGPIYGFFFVKVKPPEANARNSILLRLNAP